MDARPPESGEWLKDLADMSLAAAREKFGDAFAGVSVRPKHIGGRANAEDCPACEGTNPPFPFICPGEPEGERNEYVTCSECGRKPIGDYPVAHEPACSRMTLAPHLWPSHIPPPE
jgi:hypothetical protein